MEYIIILNLLFFIKPILIDELVSSLRELNGILFASFEFIFRISFAISIDILFSLEFLLQIYTLSLLYKTK